VSNTNDRGLAFTVSLRDYFAAAALPELIREAFDQDHEKWDATAQHAYFIADAMIEARKESK
jgi:hypothetical protein